MGCIMLSPVADSVPHSLSGADLQDYASYGSGWIDLIEAKCSAQEP